MTQENLKLTKEVLQSALKDAIRENCPMDMKELASEFGITTEEAEQILES